MNNGCTGKKIRKVVYFTQLEADAIEEHMQHSSHQYDHWQGFLSKAAKVLMLVDDSELRQLLGFTGQNYWDSYLSKHFPKKLRMMSNGK